MTDSSSLMIEHTTGSENCRRAIRRSNRPTVRAETHHNVRVFEHLKLDFEVDIIRMPDEFVHSKLGAQCLALLHCI